MGIQPGEIIVLHVSNLKPRKQPLEIVDVAVRLRRQNCAMRFVIVGDGPMLGALREYAHEQEVEDRFVFTGWVPHEKIVDYYNLADIMLVTSAGEGQSLAQLEYQACEGTLVVGDAPGARELVDDRRTGLLYRAGDADEACSILLQAAADAGLRGRMGRLAREQVLRTHTIGKMEAMYAERLEAFVETEE